MAVFASKNFLGSHGGGTEVYRRLHTLGL
jgi:hypothetical protein